MVSAREVLCLTFQVFNYASLGILCYKTWKYFFDTLEEDKKLRHEDILHHKRHNCVVTFSKGKGHAGWCGIPNTHLNINNVRKIYEPFLYFIDTAKESLDVAIMSINVKCIIESLISAAKRGVKVRVISNFYMGRDSLAFYKEMHKNGIFITLYVSKEKSNSIMHTKYIVKDFNKQNGGYLLAGSFNLTTGAFSNNYEDVVFTSQKRMVAAFNIFFSEMWQIFERENRCNMFNRLVLENAGFEVIG